MADSNAYKIMKLEKRLAELELLELKLQLEEIKYRNDIYKVARHFKGRYLVFIGGSGSGKSYEFADMIIDRMVHETKERIGKPHRFLCVRAERNKVTESMFPLLKSRAQLRYPDKTWKINSAEGKEAISLGDNEIIFAGLDDAEKLKSIFDITGIWVEEADQITFEDFRELDRRLRGYPGVMQIYLSFNPVSVLSWLKKRFFDERGSRTITIRGRCPFEDFTYFEHYELDKNALKEKISVHDEHSGKDIEEYYYNTLIIHSTYLDNKFIDAGYYRQMEELKRYDANEYNVYALGQWGVSGGLYFDGKNVNDRILNAPQPLRVGYFDFEYVNHGIIDSSIQWIDDKDGYIKIYEEPRVNTPYVLGGDTAGDGSDYNVGFLTNNLTGEDAAVIRVQFDEDLFARQMYCLGKWYGNLNNCANNALIGIETNFSTHPQKEIERMGYDNLYVREESPDSFSGNIVKKFGFQTTTKTRPLALGMLRTIVREEPHKIKDLDLLYEMTSFVKNEKGKPVAMAGAHDDVIMARAINCYIASQQINCEMDAFENADLSKLPEDLLDDYLNASDDWRRMMIDRWKKQGLI